MHCFCPFPSGALTGDMYLDFLENILPQLLEDVHLRTSIDSILKKNEND